MNNKNILIAFFMHDRQTDGQSKLYTHLMLINTGNLHQKFQPSIFDSSRENLISLKHYGRTGWVTDLRTEKVNYRVASLIKNLPKFIDIVPNVEGGYCYHKS